MARWKDELAQVLRNCDLLTIPTKELGPLCQAFGLSGKGQREELIERLHRGIWRIELDDSGLPVKLKTWEELNRRDV
jgi:hypothetical protein